MSLMLSDRTLELQQVRLLPRTPCDLEIIVPAFNEEHRLPATLGAVLQEVRRIEGWDARVVVVDNGSSDRTCDVVDEFGSAYGAGVTVVGCSEGGKGAAVRRGVLASRARFVGFLDADLAVPAAVVHEVVALLQTGVDVVIGSRRCAGATYEVRQPPVRRMSSWAFRRAIRGLIPGIADTQCGFKFFSAPVAGRIFSDLSTAGFTFDVELLARAHALGYSIVELPVAWSDGAASTLRPAQHGGQILRELVQLRRLAPRLTTAASDHPTVAIAASAL